MSAELYTLLAMAARYWFCALMVIIAFRAWRMTIVDNRRSRILRDWMPESGCVGQFVVNPSKSKKRTVLPVPREGVLGSARYADVCVRSRDVKRCHLTLEKREGGLLIKPQGRAQVTLNAKHTGDRLFMRDGDTLEIGATKLLLVLFDPDGFKKSEAPFDEQNIWGAGAPAPEAAHPARRKRRQSAPVDEIKDFEDELWPED